MKYTIYKLSFTAPVHFGKTALSNSECTLCSDTLFSALCSEAVGESQDKLDEFVNYVRNGVIKISDALPDVNDEYSFSDYFLSRLISCGFLLLLGILYGLFYYKLRNSYY